MIPNLKLKREKIIEIQREILDFVCPFDILREMREVTKRERDQIKERDQR